MGFFGKLLEGNEEKLQRLLTENNGDFQQKIDFVNDFFQTCEPDLQTSFRAFENELDDIDFLVEINEDVPFVQFLLENRPTSRATTRTYGNFFATDIDAMYFFIQLWEASVGFIKKYPDYIITRIVSNTTYFSNTSDGNQVSYNLSQLSKIVR